MNRSITVLYVDDEDANLFLFDRSFSSAFTVLTALSGEEGLAVLEEHQNDIIVVITDMKMPGMSGVEFVRLAKERFKNIAYYVLTAFNFNKEVESAIEEKIVDKFFTKPFDVEQIITEVQSVAGRMGLKKQK